MLLVLLSFVLFRVLALFLLSNRTYEGSAVATGDLSIEPTAESYSILDDLSYRHHRCNSYRLTVMNTARRRRNMQLTHEGWYCLFLLVAHSVPLSHASICLLSFFWSCFFVLIFECCALIIRFALCLSFHSFDMSDLLDQGIVRNASQYKPTLGLDLFSP